MSVDNKRVLSSIVYYTLAALTLLSTAFFIYVLSVRDVVLWARVIYYIWSGFLIGAVIFDIICTTTGESKMISGYIFYILGVLSVAMAIILYFINSRGVALAANFFNMFVSVSIVSLMAIGYGIATWCTGEKLVENATVQGKAEE